MDAITRSKQRKHQRDPYVLTVRPRKLETMDLGTYAREDTIPEFSFDYLPDTPDAIGTHIVRIVEAGGTRVIAQFQSYSNEPIIIFGKIASRS